MRTRPSLDKGRIKNTTHAHYYAAEIPHRYWDAEIGDPSFETILWGERRKISVDHQQAWYEKIRSGKAFRLPNLIFACAYPSDELALAQVYALCKMLVIPKDAQPPRISIEIAADEPRVDGYQEGCALFVLTNVLSTPPSRSRVTGIRDWMVRHEDACRIVVISGTAYGAYETYGVEPTACLQFGGTTRFVKSFG